MATNTVNIRHDWYQTESYVVVTILARNVKGEDVSVEYTDKTLNVILKVPSQDDYNLKLNLAHKIVPNKCSYRVMSTKVEITLIKHDGLQWSTLEGEAPKDATTCTGPPKYPTSHKVHKDWDAIEREIVKEFAAVDKPQGQDGVNSLFQKIYGDGDDEVKRAMNKSFMESGGTVLSTNWKEISKDKVQVKPPDGMEWKQWN